MSGPLFVGVDVGSSATKCVVIDRSLTLLGHHVIGSGLDYAQAAGAALREALRGADALEADIRYCVATGYGRERVARADRHVTEITCHARGARQWYPEVRNIIDIGGQDTKVIRLGESGRMIDYRMNAKCAAGTGTFLESTAHKLGLTMEALDDLAMVSVQRAVINSYCTVFAGTEVIERIKEGQPPQDIAMGLFRSIASRVTEMLPLHGGSVATTGGVAQHCRALIRALEEALETQVLLPPMPQHAGAFGAALLAAEDEAAERSSTSHVAKR
ncbi:MAG: acyl-CoA dehydratase activase [Phycisphaerae bacterium]